MREKDSNADGLGQRAVAIRWIQVVLFGVVVLLVGFRIWEREHGGGSSSIVFGLMAASALSRRMTQLVRVHGAPRCRLVVPELRANRPSGSAITTP
ncbi:hypothetical protein [Streptomyces sp. NPDC048106]|uniref:hypothetical protein n=1 Tax=Streptomyces sp. NPDC048106 TaxID=3155750 RepID=UPI00345329E0